MEVTKKVAENILSKVQVVHEPGVYETEHRVSKDSYLWEERFNEEGDREPDRPYKIVNTKLMSNYLAGQANDLLDNEEWGKATNKTLSFRADLDLAEKLEGSIKSQVLVEYVTLKDGERALMIRKMTPVAAKAASAFTFRKKEEVKKEDEMANGLSPEVNAELIQNETEIDNEAKEDNVNTEIKEEVLA